MHGRSPGRKDAHTQTRQVISVLLLQINQSQLSFNFSCSYSSQNQFRRNVFSSKDRQNSLKKSCGDIFGREGTFVTNLPLFGLILPVLGEEIRENVSTAGSDVNKRAFLAQTEPS